MLSVFGAALAAIMALVGIAIPEAIGSALLMTLLVQALINAVLASSVGTLLHLNGAVSFGHAAFYGLAAYTIGIAVARFGLAPELAIVLALIVPTAFAFLLGLGIVGIPGTAFSMLTLAVGQALYEFATKARSVSGGDDGFDIRFPPTIFGIDSEWFQSPQTMFIICWVVLIAVILGLSIIAKSPFGRLAIAIRENEERARFVGYHTRLNRAAVLALSAFIAAIAGVLSTLNSAFVSPDLMHWSVSGTVLVMVILGGAKETWGPAFGAVLYFFLKDIFGDYTEHWQALIGAMLIAVTLALPEGIGGTAARRIAALIGRRER